MVTYAIEVICALVPAIVLLVWIYNKDKLEHEPWKLIGLCFLFGAISCIPAGIIEAIVDIPISYVGPEESILYGIISNFIGIGLVEEGCKLWAAKRVWKKPDFNCTFDGIVYAIAASLGFAALENILYVVFAEDPFNTALVRAIVSIPGHMFFGIFLGLYLGRAKEAMCLGKPYKGLIVTGLVFAAIAHGLYDFLITYDFTIAWLIFVVVMYVIIFRLTSRAQKADRQFLHAQPQTIGVGQQTVTAGQPLDYGQQFMTDPSGVSSRPVAPGQPTTPSSNTLNDKKYV